jgi:hypothetical protein
MARSGTQGQGTARDAGVATSRPWVPALPPVGGDDTGVGASAWDEFGNLYFVLVVSARLAAALRHPQTCHPGHAQRDPGPRVRGRRRRDQPPLGPGSPAGRPG